MADVDYQGLFAKTLYELACEVFPAHGIDSMPDRQFDDMVRELTSAHFYETVSEFHRATGQSAVPKIRMRW